MEAVDREIVKLEETHAHTTMTLHEVTRCSLTPV
jgi:hypothetical protein